MHYLSYGAYRRPIYGISAEVERKFSNTNLLISDRRNRLGYDFFMLLNVRSLGRSGYLECAIFSGDMQFCCGHKWSLGPPAPAVEIVMLEKLDCISKSATRPYIYEYKCECVRTHLCIDPSGRQQSPVIRDSPPAI